MTVEATRRTDRGAAAVELLTTLYPPPLSVSAGGAARRGERAVWTAVPTAENPRLLVPGSGAAATRAVRRQLTSDRLRTRFARTGLAVAAGTGVLHRVPRLRVAVTGPVDAPSIEDPLREVLGVDELRLAMPVGPARSNRKPVLQVTDARGAVLAFVKVGHHELTRRLVRQEAAALTRLAQDPPAGVVLPRPTALRRWREHDVLVLDALEIPARRLAGEAARRRLQMLVLAIAAVGGTDRRRWDDHPHRARLHGALERCGGLAAPLRRQLDRVPPALEILTGSWHGDLNAGNIALVPGPCPVWDWERFDDGVPVGSDLLHHDLHQAITVHGVAPLGAATRLLRDASAILAPLGVEAGTADAVARSYLVTLACRYLADGQAEAGADLGRVGEWLLPALEGVSP